MFDAVKETENIVDFIKEYYKKYNLGGAVLGISGGKDSAIVAGLLTKALGSENVLGLTLPCHSTNEDKTDAELVAKHFGFKLVNIDLTNVFDTFKNEIAKIPSISLIGEEDKLITEEQLKNSDINLKPKLRMASCYYMAALMSALTGKTYLVAGTSNKSELYVGYFTKGGDSVCDIAVIADFTVSEVIKIGEVIGVPSKVLYKIPSDGLSNQTDEDKLGVKYSEIEEYIKNGEMNNTKLSAEVKNKINKLHESCRHKFDTPGTSVKCRKNANIW